MSEAAGPGPDADLAEFSEELRDRVKSELSPGERLIWTGRRLCTPVRWGASTWFGLATVSFLFPLALVSFIQAARGFGDPSGLVLSGVLLSVVVFFVVLALIAGIQRRWGERSQQEGTLYALTDRRAIIWQPQGTTGAVNVYTVTKGSVDGVHRLEFPDGTGDVLFKVPGLQFGDEYWGPTGFARVTNVRLVEELVRRTLVKQPGGES